VVAESLLGASSAAFTNVWQASAVPACVAAWVAGASSWALTGSSNTPLRRMRTINVNEMIVKERILTVYLLLRAKSTGWSGPGTQPNEEADGEMYDEFAQYVA